MKLSTLTTLFSLIFSYSSAQKTSQSDEKKFKIALDSLVKNAASSYLSNKDANGITVGIYKNKNKYVYSYGNLETINGKKLPTGNLYYNIGSIAKTFSSLLLAQAVIEHKVSLKDDIRKYMPGKFPNLQFEGQPIRLVNLSNHTSCLPARFHNYPAKVLDSLGKLNLVQVQNFYNRYSKDSLLDDLHELRPEAAPGTQYLYNGNTVMILILILERIYHQPYEQLLTHFLNKHFGMYHTKNTLTAADMQWFVQGYDNQKNPQPYISIESYTGGPSINSTINDMLLYLKANLDEKDKALKLTHKLTWSKKDGFGLGLGWMISYEDHVKYIYHDGNTKLGFNALCIFYPQKNYGIMIIVNDTIDISKVGDVENYITRRLPK